MIVDSAATVARGMEPDVPMSTHHSGWRRRGAVSTSPLIRGGDEDNDDDETVILALAEMKETASEIE